MFFYYNGDLVYAQTWEVLTLENPIEPPLINVVILNLNVRYQNRYFELNSIAQHFWSNCHWGCPSDRGVFVTERSNTHLKAWGCVNKTGGVLRVGVYYIVKVYVVVNFSFQVIFVFLLFWVW